MRSFSMRRAQRTGTMIICVLACLVIVTALAASMLKSALSGRKAVRQELQLSQTEFLLEAGIQRAVQKFNDDPEYTGEAWQLTKEVIPNCDSAVVEIAVSPATDDQPAQIEVIAQIPADAPQSVRRSYTFPLSNEE